MHATGIQLPIYYNYITVNMFDVALGPYREEQTLMNSSIDDEVSLTMHSYRGPLTWIWSEYITVCVVVAERYTMHIHVCIYMIVQPCMMLNPALHNVNSCE